MPAFDVVSQRGKPVTLTGATGRLMFMLDEMKGYEQIRESCTSLPVLNPPFR